MQCPTPGRIMLSKLEQFISVERTSPYCSCKDSCSQCGLLVLVLVISFKWQMCVTVKHTLTVKCGLNIQAQSRENGFLFSLSTNILPQMHLSIYFENMFSIFKILNVGLCQSLSCSKIFVQIPESFFTAISLSCK